MTTGLILTGGGARAAYQVGVLKGVAEILPRSAYNPFPIICGTSAGAINALTLAGRAGHFKLRTRKLERVWSGLHASDIYRSDAIGVIKNAAKVVLSLFHSGYGIGKPVSLLDNAPLAELLERLIKFDHLQTAIEQNELRAVAVTAMSYASGRSVAFFQGHKDIETWQRARRHGQRTQLQVQHLMASAAIPSLFPAVKVDQRYYGDGALRQLKPISPALHLGADRLFIIGVSNNRGDAHINDRDQHSPSIAQIVGHLFNSAFIDSMESDLETLEMINSLTSASDPLRNDKLRPIETLLINPSEAIDDIAEQHISELPRPIRTFLKITGGTSKGGGASAASYLLFEPGFCNKLIDMGYRDALARRAEIEHFFIAANL